MSKSMFSPGAFDSLVAACKESSMKITSPIFARGKAKAAGISAHLDNVKANLSFKFLESGENGESTVLDERLVLDPVPEAKKNSSVVLNWLVTLTKQIINHVNHLGEIIKINQRSIHELQLINLFLPRTSFCDISGSCRSNLFHLTTS